MTHLLLVLLCGVVVLATYSNALDAGFTGDSRAVIHDAPQVHAVTVENIKLILGRSYWWPTIADNTYRPVTTLSFLVNYAVLGNGNEPAGYHWINLGLHWVNAALVYVLMVQLGSTALVAFFAAVLFAVHPLGTEAVTNLVGRADLLATAAVLGGLLLHIRCQRAARELWWRLALLLTATVGVLCKETAATLVGVLVLYDVLFSLDGEESATWRRITTRIGQLALKGWVLVVPSLVLMWGARYWITAIEGLPPTLITDNVLVMADFLTARFTAIGVLGQQLWQMLWPARLCWDYSVNETRLFGWDLGHWSDQQVLLAVVVFVVVLLAIAAMAATLRRRARDALFFIGFFFITLLPTSNLLMLIGSVRADRFLYLPLVGAAACTAIAAGALSERMCRRYARDTSRRAVWPAVTVYGLLGIAIVAFAVRTHIRNRDWRDDLTLFAHDVLSCPNSWRTHDNLAGALYASDVANIDRAISEAETAQAIFDHAAIPSELAPGVVLEHLGGYYTAKAESSPEPERRHWYARAAGALERAALAQQFLDAACRQAERRRGKRPQEIPEYGNVALYRRLGNAYLQLNESHRAVDALRHARRLAPLDADIAAALASAYAAAGDNQNAILSLLEAFVCDSRQNVWPRLFALYREVDPGGCAFVEAAGQYQFNHACPIVHRHICAALERQIEALVAAADLVDVKKVRDAAVTEHGCPAIAAAPATEAEHE